MRELFLLFCCVSFFGCSALDNLMFKHYGKQIFSSNELVSIKEVHIDNASFEGRDLIVEGVVSSVGPHATYAVLSDSSSRLLIKQTNIARTEDKISKVDVGNRVRVFGSVITRNRGLPTVEVKVVSREALSK